jgi:hypothetical protein
LAVSTILGTASASYALKNEAGLARQDQPLVGKNVKGEHLGTIRGAFEDPLGNIAFVIVTLREEKSGRKEVVVPVNAFSQGSESGTSVLA